MDDAGLRGWIGRQETSHDLAAESPLSGLAALLDHEAPPWPAGEVPPLGHWLYFLPRAAQSRMDIDGHPQRGGLIPPVELPRRMWAGSRVQVNGPLPLGGEMSRVSRVADVQRKSGASGEMVFVTLRHEVAAGGVVRIVEEQDLVYRQSAPAEAAPAGPVAPDAPPATPLAVRRVSVNEVQLFRFSALTFNAHRIHYDRPYATGVEGYPGLVVHGPYIATLLMDHFLRARPGALVRSFAFRARRPLFDNRPFDLCLADGEDGARLWAADEHGRIAMSADLTCA
jgi:3-methylfumaryl-CoA hydratase